MEGNSSLPSALYKWAYGEMGLIPEQGSTVCSSTRTFASNSAPDWDGICLGPMVDVWLYVLSHVKPLKSVDTIRGNLNLLSVSNINHDGSMKAVLAKRNKLQQEIFDLERQNKKLSEQFTHTRSKFIYKKKHLTHYQSLARDHKRSLFILNLLTNRIHCQILTLKDSFSASEAKISNFIPLRDSEGNEDRYKIDVSKMSMLMQESLAELVTENPNLEKIQTLKHEVGIFLANLLTRLPHPHFLKLLFECQEVDVNNTSQLTCIRGSMIDLCDLKLINQSAKSVQKQVSNLSWFCVDQSNFSEKKGKLVGTLKKQLLLLNLNVQNQLEKLFEGREDSLKIARQLANLRITYESYEATLMALKKNSLEMRERCHSMEVNQNEIKLTKTLIETNNSQVEHYSTLICTLAKKHAENATIVNSEVTDLKYLLNDKASCLRGSLIKAAESTRKILEKHAAFLKTLKPSKYFHSLVESRLVPVESLATNRFGHLTDVRISDSVIPSFLNILNIKLPYFSTFQFHHTVGVLIFDIIRMRQAAKWYCAMISEVVEKHKCLPFFEKSYHYLVSTAKGKQKTLEEEVVPVVDSRMRKIEEASNFISDVERAISDWSDDPARSIETDCMLNGQTLEQWCKNLTKTLLNSNAEV